MTHSMPPLITILGPTASGKTKLAVNLAKQLSGEIISADSRQVYKHMDIGTGKDLKEYEHIPHHLIDLVNPGDEYNLFNFALDFTHAFNDITQRRHLPFLVGGTGMYLDAVLSRYKLTIANIDEKTRLTLEKKTEKELNEILHELKPTLHNTTDTQDKERLLKAIEIALSEESAAECVTWPHCNPLILGIQIERQALKKNITIRLKERFQAGMIDEVAHLRTLNISDQRIDSFGLEYRYILKHLTGELNYNDMFQKLNAAIVHFTKQQNKWFRNLEKKGHPIIWLDATQSMPDIALAHIKAHFDV